MIVGKKIIEDGLIKGGDESNLKNGTFDLRIGEIIPVGRQFANENTRRWWPMQYYALAPQEMVWVLSKEYFDLPDNVTGLATLRTTFTHQGLLALNVGIIDSNFKGQISTAIINFSDRTRRIRKDESFFRILLFEHDSVGASSKIDYSSTRDDVLNRAASDFPRNFLNLPGTTDQYYGDQLWKLITGFVKSRPLRSIIILLFIVVVFFGSLKEILGFVDAIGLIDLAKWSELIAGNQL